jgi:probable DNA metabolism protein
MARFKKRQHGESPNKCSRVRKYIEGRGMMKYDGSIESLFSILEEVCNGANLPVNISRSRDGKLSNNSSSQVDLFDDPKPVKTIAKNPFPDTLSGIAKELYETSAVGYSNFVYAWMSEFPIEAEIIRFGYSLINAARNENTRNADKNDSSATVSFRGREAAEIVRNNRMESSVKIVLDASFKVARESHRLSGLLRFSLGSANVPIAFCSPDHFVLPILAEHFTLRFGDSPWAIIDEKRGLALMKNIGAEADLTIYDPHHPWLAGLHNAKSDAWETLWLSYFKAINNETRINPKVQLQFMPKRYWKYLPEMQA